MAVAFLALYKTIIRPRKSKRTRYN